MTDVLDRRIKGFVAELVDAAPVAPPLGPYASPSPRRPRRHRRPTVALVAVAACLGVVSTALVLVDSRDERQVEPGGRPPGVPVPEDPAKLTFVVPSQLPAGLELADAGRGTSGQVGFQEMVFWSEDFTRSGRILWGRTPGGCRAAATPGRSLPASQQEAIEAHQSATSSGSGDSVQWCDPADDVMVMVSPGRLSRSDTAEMAEGIVRQGDDLALRLPPGFRAVRTPPYRDLIRLHYQGRAPGAGELWVEIQSAGPLALERQRVDSADPASWERAAVGGRPAVKGDHVVAVLYDDHTLVVLSSASMAQDDLLAAAASLVPADPSLPKPVASDPGLCDRLGMCG